MAFWTRFIKRKSPLLDAQDQALEGVGLAKRVFQWMVRQKPFWVAAGLSLVIIIGLVYWAVYVQPYQVEKLAGMSLEPLRDSQVTEAPVGESVDTADIPEIRQNVVESRAEAMSLMRVAEVLFQQGQTDQAKENLRKAISLTSDSSLLSTAYANLANILDGEGRYDEAERFLQKSIGFNKKFVEGYHNLGVVYLHTHDYDRAQLAFQVAVREKPDYAPAHWGIGEIQSTRGNFAEAIKSYTESLRLREDPNVRLNLGMAYLQSGNVNQALNEFTSVQTSSPNSYTRYLALMNRGYALDSLRRYEEAVSDYKGALLLAPKDVDAMFNLGLAHMALGQKPEALAAFRQVILLDRDNMDAYFNAVAMHSDLGQYQEALDLIRPVHDRIPGNLRVCYQLGHLYHRVGRLGDAHEFFKKTLDGTPLEPVPPELKPDALAGLASVLDDSGDLDGAVSLFDEAIRMTSAPYLFYNMARTLRKKRKLEEAITAIGRAVAQEQANPTFVLAQAEIYFDAEFLTKAFDAYKLASELSPNDIYPRFMMAHVAGRLRMGQTAFNEYNKLLAGTLEPDVRGAIYKGMGNIYHEQGDYKQALLSYREGIGHIPKDANLFYNISRTYFQMGQYDEAYASIQKSIGLDPKSSESFTLLGAYYFKKGLMEKAYSSFEEAVRLNPENIEAYYNRDVVRKYR